VNTMEDIKNQTYKKNLSIFSDSVALKNQGKPPFNPFSFHFYPGKAAGFSNAEIMNNAKLRLDCFKDVFLKYDFPLVPNDGLYWGSWPWNILQSTQWYKPGQELADDEPLQFNEQENLKADEYEEFLRDPSDFTIRKLLPRISKALEPLKDLPPLHKYLSYPMYSAPYFASQEIIAVLEILKKLGEGWQEYNTHFSQFEEELTSAGHPFLFRGVGFPPFDMFSVYLRGLKGSMIDLIRMPDQVLAVIEFLTEREIRLIKEQVEYFKNPRVAIFAYRGVDNFLSKDQFEKFYWPSLRKLINELVDSGITPLPYFQGDFTSRLPYLLELPKGKFPIHFEIVDREKARSILGEHHSFWGNIPGSLLTLGTPAEVKEDVRNLIELFGDTNGLIIDGGVFPDEIKEENIAAVFEAIGMYYQ